MASRYEESILLSLRRMMRAIDLHSRQLARHHELTGPQLVCLRFVARSSDTTPTALARGVSLSQATVTGILDRLEARGLVTRVRSSADKRKVHVKVTERGQAMILDAPSPLSEEFSKRLGALPEGEQAMFDWVLSRVVELLEAKDVDASPMLTTGHLLAEASEVASFLDDPGPAGEDVGKEASSSPGPTAQAKLKRED